MNAITEFFAMGGYAFYVWSSYGIVAVVLIANVIAVRHRRRVLMRELARKERQAARKGAASAADDSAAPTHSTRSSEQPAGETS